MQPITAADVNPQRKRAQTSSDEFSADRLEALKLCIVLIYKANNQAPPEGVALDLEVKVWGYTLEDIPTQHLAECVKRAMRNQRDDYMLKAKAVNREWDLYREELVALATTNRDHLLMLPAPTSQPMDEESWKARHNLPDEWKRGDPIPPESDLYGVPAERAGKVWVENDIPIGNYGWYRRTKKPWELYPTADRPQRSMVNGREFLWWVDTCPGASCPGYYIEHKGPGGAWTEQKPCPDHGYRLRGQPVEPMPAPAYVPRATNSGKMQPPTPSEDAALRAHLTQQAVAVADDEDGDMDDLPGEFEDLPF